MALACSWFNTVDWAATGSWAQAVFTGVAIVGSFMIVQRQHKLQLQREKEITFEARMGRLSALKGEVRYCIMQCEVYVSFYFSDNLSAPAYRLPRLAYDQTLPLILADGLLSSDDVGALTQFYVDAISFNRCLDNLEFLSLNRPPAPTGAMPAFFRSRMLDEERERTVSKALHLVPLASDIRLSIPENYRTVPSRVEAALAAIEHARKVLTASRDAKPRPLTRWFFRRRAV